MVASTGEAVRSYSYVLAMYVQWGTRDKGHRKAQGEISWGQGQKGTSVKTSSHTVKEKPLQVYPEC